MGRLALEIQRAEDYGHFRIGSGNEAIIETIKQRNGESMISKSDASDIIETIQSYNFAYMEGKVTEALTKHTEKLLIHFINNPSNE